VSDISDDPPEYGGRRGFGAEAERQRAEISIFSNVNQLIILAVNMGDVTVVG
jgi:hypothetical protein